MLNGELKRYAVKYAKSEELEGLKLKAQKTRGIKGH